MPAAADAAVHLLRPNFAGDPTPFIVATILYAFCVAAFGTLIGAAIPNQAAAMQAVALGGFLLVFMLSGLIFPIQNIPVQIRWLSNFIWGRYYIDIVRDALLQGGGWPAVWWKVIIIGSPGRFFTPGVAQHAPHAVESVTMKASFQIFSSHRLRALLRKEFAQIRRDRRLAMSLILPPTLQLLLFSLVLNATVSNLKLGIIDDSRTPESRGLTSTLTESKSFRLAGYYYSVENWATPSAAAISMPAW